MCKEIKSEDLLIELDEILFWLRMARKDLQQILRSDETPRIKNAKLNSLHVLMDQLCYRRVEIAKLFGGNPVEILQQCKEVYRPAL